jgi:hypothetical protein
VKTNRINCSNRLANLKRLKREASVNVAIETFGNAKRVLTLRRSSNAASP